MAAWGNEGWVVLGLEVTTHDAGTNGKGNLLVND